MTIIPTFLSPPNSNMSSQKPLLLYTWKTPNGRKISILLEELKAVYGADVVDYEYVSKLRLKFN